MTRLKQLGARIKVLREEYARTYSPAIADEIQGLSRELDGAVNEYVRGWELPEKLNV